MSHGEVRLSFISLMLLLHAATAGAASHASTRPAAGDASIRLAWKDNILTLSSPRLPGGSLETWYLEAFCRRGSTDRDWHETTIPFRTELVMASGGLRLELRSRVEGGVVVRHRINAAGDEVDFRIELTNTSDKPVDIEWAQPCIDVHTFTGRGQDSYWRRCFIFTKDGLRRLDELPRETKARYVPGQVYVPEGIDLNDVNPRPLSTVKPANGVIGCFSADDRLILATAWEPTQELFQGVRTCIHNDFRIGGLKSGQTKRAHGKIYLIENDPARLVERYRTDFGTPAGRAASKPE